VTTLDASSDHAPSTDPRRIIAVGGLTLALAYGVFLFGCYLQGYWLIDGEARTIASDFVNLYAAGRLVLAGDPAAPYDWSKQVAAEVAAVGYDFEAGYGWHYPPPFLFAAASVALIPFVPAMFAWLAATGALYVAAIRAIVGHRAGMFLACGFPAVLWNVTAGQNGFLSAALIGGTLGLMQRRPLLAGVSLGLLTYKPQLGVLFPLVLVGGGHWRMFGSAAATAIALATASWLAFGSAPWMGFLHSLDVANDIVLAQGGPGWLKLQSVYALMRSLGAGKTAAWIAHGAVAGAGAVALCVLWRSRAAFELKAAALAVGIVLTTPYLFAYDLVILAVPVAFLVRLGLADGFSTTEGFALVAVGLLLLGYIGAMTQVGLAAALLLILVIARRLATNANAIAPTLRTI
jgi:hypothetical protein